MGDYILEDIPQENTAKGEVNEEEEVLYESQTVKRNPILISCIHQVTAKISDQKRESHRFSPGKEKDQENLREVVSDLWYNMTQM